MADQNLLQPRIPFTKMSWVPDVPSNALGPNEYNNGANIESDTRGIQKVLGETDLLSMIPGFTIYVDSGFRAGTNYAFIVASRDASNNGKWYLVTAQGVSNITPGVGANPNVSIPGYTNDNPITGNWVGSTFIVNDGQGGPLYFQATDTEMRRYDVGAGAPVWNYEAGITNLKAGFVRSYSSPNVGNILIAGNITKTASGGQITNFPNVVRWSQAFALGTVPQTFNPTSNNVANEVDIPVRGPILDGFIFGANFYLFTYYDTAVITPINYTSSQAPQFGVRLFNFGRGLLNENCWANTDDLVFGVDSRDIWVFDGNKFQAIGNQQVKEYFFTNLNSSYYNRVFMINNTRRNQIEIYYPSLNSTGWCDKMISFRYDLQTWNPPRDVRGACQATEAPPISAGAFDLSKRRVWYARGDVASSQLVLTGTGTSFNGSAINSFFERTNIQFPEFPYGTTTYVHRTLPELTGTGSVNAQIGGAQSVNLAATYQPTKTLNLSSAMPWVDTKQNDVRTVAIRVGSNDATDTWKLSAVDWQVKRITQNT